MLWKLEWALSNQWIKVHWLIHTYIYFLLFFFTSLWHDLLSFLQDPKTSLGSTSLSFDSEWVNFSTKKPETRVIMQHRIWQKQEAAQTTKLPESLNVNLSSLRERGKSDQVGKKRQPSHLLSTKGIRMTVKMSLLERVSPLLRMDLEGTI